MDSLHLAIGSETTRLDDGQIREYLSNFLNKLGPRDDIMLLPPDYTRFHSQAGKITRFICEHYDFVESADEDAHRTSEDSKKTPRIRIMPALGTHAPMSNSQIASMFGKELEAKEPSPFMVHDWRNDVETIGHVPSTMVSEATYGMVDEPWPAQLNKHVWKMRHCEKDKPKALVVSIGQVVPHEVMGMANFNKNLFVGVGGVEAINLSHFIGAVHGMEKMMGRASNPLRSILNRASEEFLQNELDLWYILTVIDTDKDTGETVMRGLYIGNDIECYNQACDLSLKLNFTMLAKSPKKMVVYLDEDEFHSTWLANKGIYRTRMAIADGGELVLLAPGVKQFGEDEEVDKLIRKYGYVGTPAILKAMEDNADLKETLSAVAHLIHGSSEGRFRITYCPGHLTKEEVESVGFDFANLDEMMKIYNVSSLRDGWNPDPDSSDEFYYISNPALGLWAVNDRFNDNDDSASNRKRKAVSLDSNQKSVGESGGVGGWAKPPPPSDS